MTPNNFRVKNGLTVSNGVTIEAGNLVVSTGYIVVNGATINSSSFSGTANNATYLGGYTWAAPGAIGSGAANTGAFTTLATGNTTITGFLVVNTTLRVDSSALFQGGSLFLGNYASANQTMTIAANTGFDAQLKLMEAADTYGFTIRNVNGGGLNILRHSANSTGTTALFINRDTGNIGVANSSPSHKLSVNGTTYLQGVT